MLKTSQRAAEFAVASELEKRGYQVAFGFHNTPAYDLQVVSPTNKQFTIDVKGQYRKAFWIIKPKDERSGLFYVLAFVPKNEPNQFFILTQEEVNAEIPRYLERVRAERLKKGLSEPLDMDRATR